jgi:hypothetical protein
MTLHPPYHIDKLSRLALPSELIESHSHCGIRNLELLSDQCTERGGSLTVRLVITQIFCVPRKAILSRGATVELRPAF